MEIPLGSSKLGGQPDLPEDAAWPLWDDMPMSFVAQINTRELPSIEGVIPICRPISCCLSFTTLDNPRGVLTPMIVVAGKRWRSARALS
jgi:hypothetical protein